MVHLLDYTSGSRQVMATITVAKGRPVIDGEVPPRVRSVILSTWQRSAGKHERFFDQLPQVFSGSYLRAERVEGGGS